MNALQQFRPTEVKIAPGGRVWYFRDQANQPWYSSTSRSDAYAARTRMVLAYCRRVDGWAKDWNA